LSKLPAYIWVILAVLWSLFDIAVHVLTNNVELLRILGNLVLIAGALSLWSGAPRIGKLALAVVAALVVVGLNGRFAQTEGVAVLMLIFVGVGLFLLLGAAFTLSFKWMSRPLRLALTTVCAGFGTVAVAMAALPI